VWRSFILQDASIADDTSSRFLNYYIEGQKWLFETMHLAGLYYDGNGGERAIQQRIRRMSEMLPPDVPTNGTLAVFDVHGRAFQYVEELPYFDSMWTCEGSEWLWRCVRMHTDPCLPRRASSCAWCSSFCYANLTPCSMCTSVDFSRDADYWLISIAAIPFGTFGEMLGRDSCTAGPAPCVMQKGEAGANRWRGLLYAMTNRALVYFSHRLALVISYLTVRPSQELAGRAMIRTTIRASGGCGTSLVSSRPPCTATGARTRRCGSPGRLLKGRSKYSPRAGCGTVSGHLSPSARGTPPTPTSPIKISALTGLR
jgi:hypothetical protein